MTVSDDAIVIFLAFLFLRWHFKSHAFLFMTDEMVPRSIISILGGLLERSIFGLSWTLLKVHVSIQIVLHLSRDLKRAKIRAKTKRR